MNVDADKILITKKTDHKTLQEFNYQYHHAPLYLDRLEAINAAISQQTTKDGLDIMLSALKDKYHGLRVKAIRSLKMDSAGVAKAALPVLAGLASHDANYPVRAAAIGVLSKTRSADYIAIYKASLGSPSYTVKGAALIALNNIAPADAFKSAKSMEADGKGQLGQAIVTVYATSGSDVEWPYVIDAFNKSSVQQKYNLTQGPLMQMICRLNNSAYAQQGITAIKDLAISFKRFNIAPKLIAALQQIEEARKKLNDAAGAKATADAIDGINKAKE